MAEENPIQTNDFKYWVAFSRILKIGPIRFRRLYHYFRDAGAAWRANLAELMASGLEEKLADEIIILRSQIDPDAELEKMASEKIGALRVIDEDYPALLKQIFDPPFLLYYKGDLTGLKNPCVAVVGTRKFSPYGQRAAENLAGDLAAQGITIVSGLALGIDAIAHAAVLASHGLTAGVLGSGLDEANIFPSTNRHLAHQIVEHGGCLLSEFPLGTYPTKQNYPRRNRIIAGLSLGALIIEAKESSGSLITAKCALNENREVFAVPGSIYSSNSFGTNQLIKQGAKMVTTAQDILDELNLGSTKEIMAPQAAINLSGEEKNILTYLSSEPLHIDKISQLSQTKINVLLSTLAILEMKNIVKDLGGKNYILK